jgi:hypothetical protein
VVVVVVVVCMYVCMYVCKFIRITPWPVLRLQMGEMAPRRLLLRVISRWVAESFDVNCEADMNVWVRNGRNVAFRTEYLSARFIL